MFEVRRFVEESNLIEGYSGEPYYSNHMDAYLFLLEHGVTSRTIREAHSLLMNGLLDMHYVGCFREIMVTVGGHMCPKPHMFDRMFEILFKLPLNTIDDVFEWHYFFECIHPFVDGNGRIGRCILNAQAPNGYQTIIYDSKKQSYYSDINRYRRTKFKKLVYGEDI